jgi:alkanesulfonate monooxygenase SsuD/methylene tetrahydromethanopterin reductase-like flavin-dependent oxidoreductase (luciferase family)
MKFGLHGVNLHGCAQPDTAARFARAAEAAGFDSLWVADHVVLPDPPVPGRPMATDMPLLDPIVSLTFLAAHTERVLLGTGVIILPQRQALVIAKQLASLDVLSKGRLVFGLGVGWCEPEMRSVGAAFADRGRIADEYLAAMRAVWTQTKPAYKGRHVAFEGVQAMPRPADPGADRRRRPHGPGVPPRRDQGHGWYGFGLDVATTETFWPPWASAALPPPADLGRWRSASRRRRRRADRPRSTPTRAGVDRLILRPSPEMDAPVERSHGCRPHLRLPR